MILAAAGASSIEHIREYSPTTVKKAVAGYGLAQKEDVANALKRIFGKGLELGGGDESDALAIGLTHILQNQSKLESLGGQL